jgi:putative hydrolase of the HAD superfamily
MIEEALALSRYVPWSFVSCDTGVRKPDPRAFLGPARSLGRPPAELVLVDDRAANCEAARAAGLDAIHFTDASSLADALATRGLLGDARSDRGRGEAEVAPGR